MLAHSQNKGIESVRLALATWWQRVQMEPNVGAGLRGIHFRRFALSHMSQRLLLGRSVRLQTVWQFFEGEIHQISNQGGIGAVDAKFAANTSAEHPAINAQDELALRSSVVHRR